MSDAAAAASAWSDAVLAASLLAVDPAGAGGVVLRALPGPVRDRWLALLRDALPPGAPVCRVPLHVTDGRLLGGLDLAATLAAGRPVAERGLLADADGGVLLLAMAERLEAAAAARIAPALDAGEVAFERDGLGARIPTRFGVVALDEGMSADERPPAALAERLAFHLDLAGVAAGDAVGPRPQPAAIAAARAGLPAVRAGSEIVHALCAAAMALGIDSLRAPLLAVRVARAAAALAGEAEVSPAAAEVAARLVLAPRATAMPRMPEAAAESASAAPSERDAAGPDAGDADRAPAPDDDTLPEIVLAAAAAALPAALLDQLRAGRPAPGRGDAGRAGAHRSAASRGRPIGVRRGDPRSRGRLSLVDTLRAAAPWQPLRRAEARRRVPEDRRPARVAVRREDFRIRYFEQHRAATTIFAVDASGSAALARLAEAKGAVERLLAECYVRRDRVALVAFRGRGAELILPPTRSLVRAKRGLAGLPGGGGTPLAAGLEAAAQLADGVLRRGGTPFVVVLTDGRANVARDGSGGRERAEADALAAARALRAASVGALLVDTSPRPQAAAERIAREMDALYVPLPHADSAALCDTVRRASGLAARRAGLAKARA